jgi:hypothetical protein
MAGYSRDFLIDAYVSRFLQVCSIEKLLVLEQLANDLYDRVGRDSFRTYASLDAEAIRQYRKQT